MLKPGTNNPAMRRYMMRLFLALTVYVVFLVGANVIFQRFAPSGWVAVSVAILPALPIVAILASVGMYLAEEKDELERYILVQAIMWAIGGTLSTATIWGFLQDFVHYPPMHPFYLFPIFWVQVAVVGMIAKARYR